MPEFEGEPGKSFGELGASKSLRAVLTEGEWSGWCWQRGRWRLACTMESLAAAALALSAAADQLHIPDADTILCRAGSMPSGPPLGRRKRS